MMTDKDKQLIAEARRVSYTDWGYVLELAEKTDTKEASDIIRQIAVNLHHKEESYCDCL